MNGAKINYCRLRPGVSCSVRCVFWNINPEKNTCQKSDKIFFKHEKTFLSRHAPHWTSKCCVCEIPSYFFCNLGKLFLLQSGFMCEHNEAFGWKIYTKTAFCCRDRQQFIHYTKFIDNKKIFTVIFSKHFAGTEQDSLFSIRKQNTSTTLTKQIDFWQVHSLESFRPTSRQVDWRFHEICSKLFKRKWQSACFCFFVFLSFLLYWIYSAQRKARNGAIWQRIRQLQSSFSPARIWECFCRKHVYRMELSSVPVFCHTDKRKEYSFEQKFQGDFLSSKGQMYFLEKKKNNLKNLAVQYAVWSLSE